MSASASMLMPACVRSWENGVGDLLVIKSPLWVFF